MCPSFCPLVFFFPAYSPTMREEPVSPRTTPTTVLDFKLSAIVLMSFVASVFKVLKQTLRIFSKRCLAADSSLWSPVGLEAEAPHQASLPQPNLLAAIDIPFPVSLLSCFAFRGFALSPECPACGLSYWRHRWLCRYATIIESFIIQ